jgi:hypothetical protein
MFCNNLCASVGVFTDLTGVVILTGDEPGGGIISGIAPGGIIIGPEFVTGDVITPPDTFVGGHHS